MMQWALTGRMRLSAVGRVRLSRKPHNRGRWTSGVKMAVTPSVALSIGTIGISTVWHHCKEATLCEAPAAEASDLDLDETMINAYVKDLMNDRDIVQLPFGMEKSAVFLLDVFTLHKTLVKEAIGSFEWTVDNWNHPRRQGMLAGHPIVYMRTRTHVVQHLVHNPNLAVPFEVLEMVADALLEHPQMTEHHSFPVRWLPRPFKRLVIINMLHVLTSVLVDLMLTSSVSVHRGAFAMHWTFDPHKADAYYQSLRDKDTIESLIRDALEQIDFEAVQELAADTVASGGEQNSWIFALVGQDLYATAYKIMLIVFYMFNWDTECRMMGRSVRQKFVKPVKKSR